MITDTTCQAYRIAETLAVMKRCNRDTSILLDFFEDATRGMKHWERLAIKETFHNLAGTV